MDRRSMLAFLAACGAMRPAWSNTAGDGRLVWGFPPGAIGTTLAQNMLQNAGDQLGASFKLDVVTGASARRSAEVVSQASPDGLTLLQAQSALVSLFPATYRSLKYSPLQDLLPIANLGRYTFAFTVGPAVPKDVATIDDYLRWAMDNPDFRNYGVVLNGSQGYIAGAELCRQKGLAIRPVVFSGTSPLTKDILAGDIAAGFTVVGNNLSDFAVGQLRVLAVTSGKRWPGLPNVPTMAESGIDDLNINGWYGWFAPAGIGLDRARELSKRVYAIAEQQRMRELYGNILLERTGTPGPEEIQDQIRKEIDEYKAKVQSLKINLIE